MRLVRAAALRPSAGLLPLMMIMMMMLLLASSSAAALHRPPSPLHATVAAVMSSEVREISAAFREHFAGPLALVRNASQRALAQQKPKQQGYHRGFIGQQQAPPGCEGVLSKVLVALIDIDTENVMEAGKTLCRITVDMTPVEVPCFYDLLAAFLGDEGPALRELLTAVCVHDETTGRLCIEELEDLSSCGTAEKMTNRTACAVSRYCDWDGARGACGLDFEPPALRTLCGNCVLGLLASITRVGGAGSSTEAAGGGGGGAGIANEETALWPHEMDVAIRAMCSPPPTRSGASSTPPCAELLLELSANTTQGVDREESDERGLDELFTSGPSERNLQLLCAGGLASPSTEPLLICYRRVTRAAAALTRNTSAMLEVDFHLSTLCARRNGTSSIVIPDDDDAAGGGEGGEGGGIASAPLCWGLPGAALEASGSLRACRANLEMSSSDATCTPSCAAAVTETIGSWGCCAAVVLGGDHNARRGELSAWCPDVDWAFASSRSCGDGRPPTNVSALEESSLSFRSPQQRLVLRVAWREVATRGGAFEAALLLAMRGDIAASVDLTARNVADVALASHSGGTSPFSSWIRPTARRFSRLDSVSSMAAAISDDELVEFRFHFAGASDESVQRAAAALQQHQQPRVALDLLATSMLLEDNHITLPSRRLEFDLLPPAGNCATVLNGLMLMLLPLLLTLAACF